MDSTSFKLNELLHEEFGCPLETEQIAQDFEGLHKMMGITTPSGYDKQNGFNSTSLFTLCNQNDQQYEIKYENFSNPFGGNIYFDSEPISPQYPINSAYTFVNALNSNIQNKSENNLEIDSITPVDNAGSENLGKETRWSKKDDIALYHQLENLCDTRNIDINTYREKKGKMNKVSRQLLHDLKAIQNWRGTIYELRTRLSKILTTSKFTVREIRKLKKLMRQETEEKITLKEIHYMFPGKTFQQIVDFKMQMNID